MIEPGNAFLGGCGVVGALAGDGSAEVGHFWSAALGAHLLGLSPGGVVMADPDGKEFRLLRSRPPGPPRY